MSPAVRPFVLQGYITQMRTLCVFVMPGCLYPLNLADNEDTHSGR